MLRSNLLIDIGNTSAKFTLSQGGDFGEIYRADRDSLIASIEDIIKGSEVDITAISSVVGYDEELVAYLNTISKRVIILNSETELPVTIAYKTPPSLGADRIAAAVAVAIRYPGEKCLIFDFGTAITIDFLSEDGILKGGNISPGMNMRFKALNKFTKKLPLCEKPVSVKDIGDTTRGAIEAGVVLGIMFEVEGYLQKYQDHKVIFSGGDALYFAEKLKNPIFAVFNLVLIGLSYIADYHANN